MKITTEPTEGFSFNDETGKMEPMKGTRVEWQDKPGGSRRHVVITMESDKPADMLRAAAAYFEAQGAS